MTEIDIAAWQRTLDVVLTGTWLCMKHEIAAMLRAYRAGDHELATSIFFSMAPVATGLFRAPAVSLTKAALSLQGRPAGPPRLPLLPADEDQLAALAADLAEADVRTST